jgi:hypothetical protein
MSVVWQKAWHHPHAGSSSDVKLVLLVFAVVIMLHKIQFACHAYLAIEACEAHVENTSIKFTLSGHS